jgi:hypothetical protein
MPQELGAAEKSTWLAGEEVVVPPTGGGGGGLGLSGPAQATSAGLQEAYGEFKAEASPPSFPSTRHAAGARPDLRRPAPPGASSFRSSGWSSASGTPL